LLDVVEDKFFALVTDVGDSAGEGNGLLEPLAVLSIRSILLQKLADGELDVEFVGVGVSVRILLEFSYHFRPVFEVGGRVENLLFFDFFLLALSLLGLFGCFLCLLGVELLLLLETLLLVLAGLLAVLVSFLSVLLRHLGFFLSLDFNGLFRLLILHL
jgi:hypothetical protein